MYEFCDRAADHATRAHAEQALGRRVQLGDRERVVEHDERDREALKNVVGIGHPACPARPGDRLERGRRRVCLGAGAYLGFATLVCWTMKVVGAERATSLPLASITIASSV